MVVLLELFKVDIVQTKILKNWYISTQTARDPLGSGQVFEK